MPGRASPFCAAPACKQVPCPGGYPQKCPHAHRFPALPAAAGTVLGGITFRNVLVQYDLQNGRAGFAQTDCSALGG